MISPERCILSSSLINPAFVISFIIFHYIVFLILFFLLPSYLIYPPVFDFIDCLWLRHINDSGHHCKRTIPADRSALQGHYIYIAGGRYLDSCRSNSAPCQKSFLPMAQFILINVFCS